MVHNAVPAGMLLTSMVLDVRLQSCADSHALISIGIPLQAAFNSHFVSKELDWYHYNQRPSGAGRVFMKQITQWKQFESILTHHSPSEPFILWLLAEPPDTWELGVRGGLSQTRVHFIDGKTCRKPAVTFVPGIVLSALDTCLMHSSKELLSHCIL